VLITHESAEAVDRMLAYWGDLDPDAGRIVAYGGSEEEFGKIGCGSKVFVDDPALRTRDHPRERQSYLGVFRAVLPELVRSGCGMVHIAEYDEVPVVPRIGDRIREILKKEDADVLGHGLRRVDGSSNPHWLNHVNDDWFGDYWASMSRRDDATVVLAMLGCGSFWRMEAFRQVAMLEPPGRIYLELFLPTAAHHLGFRVRPFPDQSRFMHPNIIKTPASIEVFRSEGAWTVHPVKGMWSSQ